MVLLTNHQNYLHPHVTLISDFLIPKSTVSCPWHMDHCVSTGIKPVHSFSQYRADKVGNGQTDGQTDKRMDNRRT